MKWQQLIYAGAFLAVLAAAGGALGLWTIGQGSAHAESLAPRGQAVPQAVGDTTFLYQGQLTVDGDPADGAYDLRFKLFGSPEGVDQIGGTLTADDYPISGGLLSIDLNFGGVFDGSALYLEIGARPAAETGEFTVLHPRQPLLSTPYATFASSIADGAVMASSIGEPCAEGQVLAQTGDTWSCADAELDTTPTQQVSHTVNLSGTVLGGAMVVLDTLGINTEVNEVDAGFGILIKQPGYTHYEDFYVVCTEPCPFLEGWYDDVVAAGGPSVPRGAVTVTIAYAGGPGAYEWHGSWCWPSQLAGQLSPDGGALHHSFRISCDSLDLALP